MSESAQISTKDLKELITELRKPVKTEEEIERQRQAKEDRAQLAEMLKATEANKKAVQEACSHIRRDGSTTAVYIQNGSFLFCQVCALVIRPEERPDVFNRLYQLTLQ